MPAKNTYEEELLKWKQQYQNTAGAKPADYQSVYAPQMQSIMSQYQNREPFVYDMNSDALYQQYKDRYISGGKQAMQDTMGKAAAMTGGYGNTYAQTAGQQQYNQYMQGLNDVIPQLADRAYQRYYDEGNKLLNQFSLAGQMEGQDYQKYQDLLSAWQNQQAFDYGAMQEAQGQLNWYDQFEYGKEQDALAQSNWQTQFNYGQQQDALAQQNWQEQFQYGKEQDALSQQNWQTQFNYGKEFDTAQANFQAAQFEYQKAMDEKNFQAAEYWKTQQAEYQKQMDEQAQANWDKQFGYGVETDEKQQAYQLAMTLLQSGKMPTDQMLETAGIDKETAGMLRAMMSGSLAGTVVGGSTSRSSNGGSGKKLTADAWDEIQAAGETGGKDAMFKIAAKYEAMGYNVQPVIDWSGTYLKPQWDADQKKIEDSHKAVDGLMNFGSAVYNTVGSLVPNALSSIFKAFVPKKPEPEEETPPKKDYKDRLGR